MYLKIFVNIFILYLTVNSTLTIEMIWAVAKVMFACSQITDITQ